MPKKQTKSKLDEVGGINKPTISLMLLWFSILELFWIVCG